MKNRLTEIAGKVWFLPVLFFACAVLFSCLLSYDEISYAVTANDRQEIRITVFDEFECKDCRVSRDGTVTVTGEDPWIWILGQELEIGRIDVCLQSEPKGRRNIRFYFDTGSGFTDEDAKDAEIWQTVTPIMVKQEVLRLRVDFEGFREGEQIYLEDIVINPHLDKEQKLFLLLRTAANACFFFLLAITVYLFGIRRGILFWIIVLVFWFFSAVWVNMQLRMVGWQVLAGAFVLWLFEMFLLCLLRQKQQWTVVFFFGGMSVVYLLWIGTIPPGGGPDEEMRYLVPQFIARHGSLPAGTDAEIRNEVWGTSYGFTPTICYLLHALFLKAGTALGTDSDGLYFFARAGSAVYSLLAGAFSRKIGRLFFSEKMTWVFTAFIMLLPQYVFVSSCVGCDAFGMLGSAVLIWQVFKGEKQGFPAKSCIGIGAGISLCLLSYYNTYGNVMVLCIYCCVLVLCGKLQDQRKRVLFLTRCIGIVLLTAVVLSGWWFVRNYLLYDGDFLGLRSSSASMETYAIFRMKPSQRQSPADLGMSVWKMLVSTDWCSMTLQSLIGVFGQMRIWMSDWVYPCYYAAGLVGLAGNIVTLKNKSKVNGTAAAAMTAAVAVTIGISLYYSRNVDFQPQGRYILPMLIPLGILVFRGYEGVACLVKKNIRDAAAAVFLLLIFAGSFTAYLQCAAGY